MRKASDLLVGEDDSAVTVQRGLEGEAAKTVRILKVNVIPLDHQCSPFKHTHTHTHAHTHTPTHTNGFSSMIRSLPTDRKSTRLNSSHLQKSRMPSPA